MYPLNFWLLAVGISIIMGVVVQAVRWSDFVDGIENLTVYLKWFGKYLVFVLIFWFGIYLALCGFGVII